MSGLVANARMYAVTAGIESHWRTLLLRAGELAGVPLAYAAHPAPAPLDALWARDDLGLAFVCGLPFARAPGRWQAIAAPVPAASGRACYATDLVVRADDDIWRIKDAFGRRVGWTVAHSQSGFEALRRHLLPHWRGEPLFAASVGPLVTPRGVIEALLAGAIDLGPLDSVWHGLLARHEPKTAARLRVVATTEPTPNPLLVAARAVPDARVARLCEAVLGLADDAQAAPHLDALDLAGFAPVDPAAYQLLVTRSREVDEAGYIGPA